MVAICEIDDGFEHSGLVPVVPNELVLHRQDELAGGLAASEGTHAARHTAGGGATRRRIEPVERPSLDVGPEQRTVAGHPQRTLAEAGIGGDGW